MSSPMSTPLEYRGFMLDSCRHFMPVEAVEKLIEAAALCGMNRMHWHLTDDQGWRIEIRRYPQLTDIGARRGWSWFGSASGSENNCGFYTQADARRVVAFAKARGIEVIPEIEIPGHAGALLAALPECGCRRLDAQGNPVERPYRYAVINTPGIFPGLLCAGRDEPLRVIEQILDEIVALFPFPMVHIGGDEAPKLRWRRCPDCRRRMREVGVETEDALQRWLVIRVGEYLASKGRQTIVWNDVLAGGLLPEHFVVQQWLGDAPQTGAFMAAGGKVICSDTEHYYFDYPYGRTDVYAVWNHPMVPAYARGHEENLLGVECPLWTEYVTNPERAAFMLLPRMAAVGLRARGDDSPDWETFAARLRAVEDGIEAATGLLGAPEALWRMSPEAAEADRAAFDAAIPAQGTQPFTEYERALVALEKVERLMEKIHMPRDFLLHVGDAVMASISGEPASDDDGALTLARQLRIAVANRENGPWTGIPEDIYIDTLAAFTRFVNEHRRATGRYGFDRGFWTTRQIHARLFRLGELEYELSGGDGQPGTVGLHIPSDARLEADAMNASVARARAFIAERFPDWADAPIVCDSWLLSPTLSELLPDTARIRRFQAAFDLSLVDPDCDDSLEWVFNLTHAQAAQIDVDALPEDTALRRGVKALLRAGRQAGGAIGTLKRAFR